jgi:hypothetical protein
VPIHGSPSILSRTISTWTIYGTAIIAWARIAHGRYSRPGLPMADIPGNQYPRNIRPFKDDPPIFTHKLKPTQYSTIQILRIYYRPINDARATINHPPLPIRYTRIITDLLEAATTTTSCMGKHKNPPSKGAGSKRVAGAEMAIVPSKKNKASTSTEGMF